jgi:predicted metal-dependent HD superfamily phosphohydrolase
VARHAEELAAHEPVGDLDAVVVAALYHDAVYDPRATDNEAASARLARRDLTALGWTDERADRVATMIEATAGHTGQVADDHGADPDTAVLLDADLSILGADPVAYQTYATGVRVEYGHVDDAAWRAGRADVLRALAARDPLYRTATARARWESRAKANVQAELATLERP